MTTSKSILTFSTLAIAMMFGGGVYVMMNLNTLVKPKIERLAGEALGVQVKIGSLDLYMNEMRARVSDIRIANPPGFSKPYALILNSADVSIAGMEQKLVTFEAIAIEGVQANVEVKQGTTNFHALQKGMKPVAPQKSEEPPLKVIIKSFVLDGAQVNPSVTLIASQDLEPVSMNPVRLQNVGGTEGVLPGDAVKDIAKPVMGEVAKAAGRAGYYQGLSTEALKDMGLGQFQGVADRVQDEVNKVGDAIKGLFR